MTIQIPLGITLPDSASFANYYGGHHAQLLEGLQRALRDGSEPFVYLWGSAGVGKTHLLHAACRMIAELGEPIAYVPLAQPEIGSEVLEGLETCALIAVDDLHVRTGDPDWELALFVLYNRMREAGGELLMAGRQAPAHLGCVMPELRSRLSWGLVLHLDGLDDAQRLAALQHRARCRGFELPDEVGQFLLRRQPRDMPALFALLEVLDQASLAAQRRLTIPFVKSVLDAVR